METWSVKFYKYNRSYNNKTLAELKGNTRATLFIHAGQYLKLRCKLYYHC